MCTCCGFYERVTVVSIHFLQGPFSCHYCECVSLVLSSGCVEFLCIDLSSFCNSSHEVSKIHYSVNAVNVVMLYLKCVRNVFFRPQWIFLLYFLSLFGLSTSWSMVGLFFVCFVFNMPLNSLCCSLICVHLSFPLHIFTHAITHSF